MLKIPGILLFILFPLMLILATVFYPLLYVYSGHPEHAGMVFRYNLFVLCFSVAGAAVVTLLYLFFTRKMFNEHKELFFKFFLGTTVIAAVFFLISALRHVPALFADNEDGYGRLFFATKFPPASVLLVVVYWLAVRERRRIFPSG
ncbi:MAG: hypothetical protein JW881_03095 [Spirochaetales bacterium]|nr:hypothetical protein [Spirochaetales bacterium]